MAFSDEKSGSVDEGKAADIVYFDSGKAFSTVSHNILTGRLKYRLGKWRVWGTVWTDRLKGLWSVAESPAGVKSPAEYPKG